MFCMHCGKQLEDGSRFCMYCGGAQETAPVVPPSQTPLDPQDAMYAAPVNPPSQTSLDPQAAFCAPAEAAPAAPVVQTALDPNYDLFADLTPEPEYPQTPPVPVPSYAEMNAYSDPVPPITGKKKKKKTGLIIALVLVLALVAAGGLGYYLYSQSVYQENLDAYNRAELLLRKGDYDGALAGFRALGDFEDAQNRVETLEALQADYDRALALLDALRFDEARQAFQNLGAYRDSETYVKYQISYLEACFAMDLAASETDPETLRELYIDAATLFSGLGDYSDAADMASECWLNVALVELSLENYEEAMSYLGLLKDGDALRLEAAYNGLCADDAFLSDIVTAMVTWLDENDTYTLGKELRLAMDLMEPYADVYFGDESLQAVRDEFLECLEIMYASLEDDETVYDAAQYYYGMYQLYCVADELYNSYGVFADDAQLRNTFVGLTDDAYAYYKIETSLTNWWEAGPSADQSTDGHYYAAYTNNSGYAYTLYAQIYFYGEDGTLLEVGDWLEIYVAKGSTIYIPTIPAQVSDDDWYSWYIVWDFVY